MDFPNVDERTDERFARLWPLVGDNEKVKAAAKDAPDMIKFSREGEGPHYRLYESRIPAGVDADKAFGGWATEEAKTASLQESASYRQAKGIGERQQKQNADERYPENIRYYPAVEAAEGKNRDAFNEIVGKIAEDRGLARKDVVQYNNSAEVKAFVSKVGPLPELAYWQTDEAKGAWAKEGEKLKVQQDKTVSRAADVVERAALQAEGKDFLANHGKGLAMPPKKNAVERGQVEAEIRGASLEDLKAVQAVSEREFKALEKKQYAIQIQAAKEKTPDLSTEDFNKMKPEERRVAAGYKELGEDEFRRMVRVKDGFFTINRELNDRGEHLTVDQARELKGKGEAVQQAKPVDEKSVGKKAEPEAPQQGGDAAPQGRQSSRGRAAAAALAGQLGR